MAKFYAILVRNKNVFMARKAPQTADLRHKILDKSRRGYNGTHIFKCLLSDKGKSSGNDKGHGTGLV